MFCPKCGKNLPDTAAFCGRCGNRITQVNVHEKNDVSLGRKGKILGFCVFFVLGIIIIGRFAHKSSNSDPLENQEVVAEDVSEEAIEEVDSAGLSDTKAMSEELSQQEQEESETINKVLSRSDAHVGDIVEIGLYEQNNVIEDGPEPIEWIVIDEQEDKLLLLSRKVLDVGPFNGTFGNISWENSSIRTWLNADFQDAVYLFVSGSSIESDHTYNHEMQIVTTSDGFFLLSQEEASRYLKGKEEWLGEATEYAINQGLKVDENNHTRWWLRSTQYVAMTGEGGGGGSQWAKNANYTHADMDIVEAFTWVDYGYPEKEQKIGAFNVWKNEWGIRPAMWINRY